MVFDASGLPPVGQSGESGEARRPLLGELLIRAKVITAEQLAEALAAQREPVNETKIGQMLIERGWMTEAQLTQALSLQLSVPWVSLYHIDFSRQLLGRVPRELAERYCLIPIFVRHVKGQGETLYVAMDDPTNEVALAEIARQATLPARPMIASATDIRSAIRLYYGEPAGPPIIDVLPRASRVDSPTTTREGMRREGPPVASTLEVPPVAALEAPRARSSVPPRGPSAPPPAGHRAPPIAPRPPHRENGDGASQAGADEAPLTTRSNPPSAARAAALAAAATGEPAPRRADEPPIPRAAGSEPRRARGKMMSLTLLDGTTVQLPSQKAGPSPERLTAREFVSALRATAHGADATEILGEQAKWEPVVAALLSLLLRKGLIADREFIEELRKI